MSEPLLTMNKSLWELEHVLFVFLQQTGDARAGIGLVYDYIYIHTVNDRH